MLDIKLAPAMKKALKDLQPDIDAVETALAALSEAGVPAPGLVSELEKVKKMQRVLLETF